MQSMTPSLMRSNWWRPSRGTRSLLQINRVSLIIRAVSKWSSPSFLLVSAVTVRPVSWAAKSFSSGIIIRHHALHRPVNIVQMRLKWKESLDPHSLWIVTRRLGGYGENSPCSCILHLPAELPASTCGASDLQAHSRSSTSHFLSWMRLLTGDSICSNPPRCHSGASVDPIIIFLTSSQVRLKDYHPKRGKSWGYRAIMHSKKLLQ